MDSNFRKYYYKDKSFYMSVIDSEIPDPSGYSFKLTIFGCSTDTNELRD